MYGEAWKAIGKKTKKNNIQNNYMARTEPGSGLTERRCPVDNLYSSTRTLHQSEQAVDCSMNV